MTAELQAKLQTLMYQLTKEAARYDFIDFIEALGITDNEYEQLKAHIQERLGVKLYC